MNQVYLKYKPVNGFEIDKLKLLQKDGEYFYQYNTQQEMLEEKIDKSIYEEIRQEKELYLSLKDYKFENLIWLERISLGLFLYLWFCFFIFTFVIAFLILELVLYILIGIINLKFEPIDGFFCLFEIPVLLFIVFQLYLTLNSIGAYGYRIEEQKEYYKELEQKLLTIQFFNKKPLEEKLLKFIDHKKKLMFND